MKMKKNLIHIEHGHCDGSICSRGNNVNRSMKHMFRGNVPLNSNEPEKRGSSLIWVWKEKIRKTYFFKKHNLSLHRVIAIQVMPLAEAPMRGSWGAGLIRLLRPKLDLQGIKCPNKLKH